MRIPLSSPDITEQEVGRVCDVLRSGTLSLGPCTLDFEEKFARYVGTRFAVAVNSGTSALHLATRAVGIKRGDEVITSSFSFVASTNCFLFEGAFPIFIDIDPNTLNLDPAAVRRFLVEKCKREGGRTVNVETGRTVKAIVPVHVFGLPCDMDAICEIAREFDLRVIEDSCEAIGATLKGRNAGTFGEAAAFAFYPNKQMTTGEGGMLVTDDERIASECRSMRNQGRASMQGWLEHERLGYNYRLSEIHAALGVAQLERINTLLKSRERVAAGYDRALAGQSGIKLLVRTAGVKRSWFVYVVQLIGGREERDNVIAYLRSQDIGCQAYFPAIHTQPYLRSWLGDQEQDLPHTAFAASSCVALPFFSRMTQSEIEHVCEHLGRAIELPHTALPTAA